MDKDDYSKMQLRKDVVLAFIARMDLQGERNLHIIPLLTQFILDGDAQSFNEYVQLNKVLAYKTAEQKLDEAIEKWESVKPKVRKWLDDFDSVKAEWEEFCKEKGGKVSIKDGKWERELYIDCNIQNPFEDYLDPFKVHRLPF